MTALCIAPEVAAVVQRMRAASFTDEQIARTVRLTTFDLRGLS